VFGLLEKAEALDLGVGWGGDHLQNAECGVRSAESPPPSPSPLVGEGKGGGAACRIPNLFF
jgi:hypothetical protein